VEDFYRPALWIDRQKSLSRQGCVTANQIENSCGAVLVFIGSAHEVYRAMARLLDQAVNTLSSYQAMSSIRTKRLAWAPSSLRATNRFFFTAQTKSFSTVRLLLRIQKCLSNNPSRVQSFLCPFSKITRYLPSCT
jgi:hypothetical protein